MSVKIVNLVRHFRRLYSSYIFLCIMYCTVFMPFVATDVSFDFRAFEFFYNIFVTIEIIFNEEAIMIYYLSSLLLSSSLSSSCAGGLSSSIRACRD